LKKATKIVFQQCFVENQLLERSDVYKDVNFVKHQNKINSFIFTRSNFIKPLPYFLGLFFGKAHVFNVSMFNSRNEKLIRNFILNLLFNTDIVP
jgi:hypothetical protein